MRRTSSPMKPITGQAPIRKNMSPVAKLTTQMAAISTMKPWGLRARFGVSTALKYAGTAGSWAEGPGAGEASVIGSIKTSDRREARPCDGSTQNARARRQGEAATGQASARLAPDAGPGRRDLRPLRSLRPASQDRAELYRPIHLAGGRGAVGAGDRLVRQPRHARTV